MWRATYSPSYHMLSEWSPVFPLGEVYQLEAVKNHSRHRSRKSRCKPVCSRRPQDFSRRRDRIGFDKHWIQLRNEERGGRKRIAQNGQGPRLFGEVARQPKPTSYAEGISPQNKQMTAVGYISDTEEIVKASWSLFQQGGGAAFKLSERSPLPPALSTKVLAGGQIQMVNVCRIRTINHHPVDRDEDSTPEIISDTEDWLIWNGYLDIPTDTEIVCTADVQSDTQQGNRIEDPDSQE